MSPTVAPGADPVHSPSMLLFAPKASTDLAARIADALGRAVSPSEDREFDASIVADLQRDFANAEIMSIATHMRRRLRRAIGWI